MSSPTHSIFYIPTNHKLPEPKLPKEKLPKPKLSNSNLPKIKLPKPKFPKPEFPNPNSTNLICPNPSVFMEISMLESDYLAPLHSILNIKPTNH